MTLKKQSFLYFLPTVFNWVVPLVMLPITTYKLDPKDYGRYGIVSAVSAIGATFAALSSNYLLANRYSELDIPGRRSLITSILQVGTGVLILYGAVALFVSSKWATITGGTLFLSISLGSALLMFPWTVANIVISLDRRADYFAKVTIAQTALNALTMSILLYGLRIGGISLLLTEFTTSTFCCLGAVYYLRNYLQLEADFQHIRLVIVDGLKIVWPNVVGNLQVYLERSMIVSVGGNSILGIYEHSKQYKTMLLAAVSSVARGIWPHSLEEARTAEMRFKNTTRAWNLLYLLMAGSGMFMACFGPFMLKILTHNKFAAAYSLATLWFVQLILICMQKPQIATIYARGHGAVYSVANLVCIAISSVIIWKTVPILGPWGAFLGLITQEIIFRFTLYVYCWRKYRLSFKDHEAWAGIAFILMTFAVMNLIPVKLEFRYALAFLMYVFLFLFYRESVEVILRDVHLLYKRYFAMTEMEGRRA